MISILRTPSTFGFVKNKNEFAVACTRMTAAGTQSYYEVTITIPASFPGSQKPSYFVIDIAGMETRLKCESIVPPADLSEAVLLRHENIAEAIKHHWGINQLFDVTYTLNTNNVVVALTAKDPGALECPRIDFEWNSGNNLGWVSVSGQLGTAADVKEGYRIVAEYEANIGGETYRTEPQYFDPDKDNGALLRTDILKGLFPEEELPSLTQLVSVPQELQKSVMLYRLLATDHYGNASRYTTQSDTLYMLNGEIEHSHYSANTPKPDWDVRHGENLNGSLLVVGENDGSSVRIHRHQPQYIYILSTKAQNQFTTVYVYLTIRNSDGITNRTGATFSLGGSKMVRVAVGPTAVGATDNTVDYSVDVWTALPATESAMKFSQRYVIIPDHYNNNLFLLQTKYGTHKTFSARSVAMQSNSGNTIYSNSDTFFIDITSCNETYTAHTGSIRKAEAAAINEALMNERHYFYAHGGWRRIFIIPESIDIVSDENDMENLSFNFRFSNKQYAQKVK